MIKHIENSKGITLIEIVLAVVIAGIIGAVALRSTLIVTESGRTEITKTELKDIGHAMVGNPDLENNGIRTDFGYVGDVGAMPPTISALMTNPGYATWNGPYMKNRFDQTPDDYSKDAWGATYSYSSVNLTSSGSGSDLVYKIGNTTSDFLINRITGNVYDSDGTPPGASNAPSISVLLTVPDGSGAYIIKGDTPDNGGYFSFDSIPIGNHDLQLIYAPTADTLKRFVSVLPKSQLYNEYFFPSDYWFSSGGSGGSGGAGITYVTASGGTTGGSCNDITFNITNTTGSPITFTSATVSWSSPVAYYKELIINGTLVFDSSNPRNGTGSTVTFAGITINDGAVQTITVEEFKTNPTGGPNMNMSNTDFNITFSDGSVVSFNSGSCP